MEENLNNIDVVHEINKIKNSSATSESKAEISGIIDTAYNEAENHEIPKELVDTIFNSKEVKAYLGKILGNTTDYIINNQKLAEVTSEEFSQILDNNIDKWIKQTNTKISDSKKEVLLIRMKNASSQILDNLPSTKDLINFLGIKKINKIQIVFSTKTRIICILTSLLSLVLITILRRKQNGLLLYVGTPILIAALFVIGTGFIIGDLIASVLDKYNISFMISTISNELGHQISISGLILGVFAIIIILTNYLLNKKTLH
ncbi:MAG: hypothetical protein IJ093_03335 [Bacilli bacterium]|nr:hypothetical protein [Bacilli bacterium]